MDAVKFLAKGKKNTRQPYYVLTGDEEFLKRQVLAVLRDIVLEDADPSFAVTTFPGDKTDISTVRNELDTIPFLSPRRFVVVEQGEKFVTEHRSALEKFVQAPSKTGVLVLDVKSWPGNTKLAKLVPDASTIVCETPPAAVLSRWAVEWCQSSFGKLLKPQAAELLLEYVGPTMGFLAAELEKLSVYVGERPSIESRDVDQLVGRSREANIWRIMDAVGEGKPAEALDVLGELFEHGEEALKLLGAIGSQVRKIAHTARLAQQGTPIDEACNLAGVPKWPAARESVKRQLRHLGRRRLDQLMDWLLEVDLGAKGGSMLSARMLMERFIVRLAVRDAG